MSAWDVVRDAGLTILRQPIGDLVPRRTIVHGSAKLRADTGYWILEERPKETTEALVKFL
jgi:hypothetical protein